MAAVSKKPFDALAFDQQMYDWITSGLSKEQIIQKAGKDWPMISNDYLDVTFTITSTLIDDEKLTNHLKQKDAAATQVKTRATPKEVAVPATDTFDPAAELLLTHSRRGKLLDQLDQRVAQDDAPVTLLNLYRGLLRDHEASCYKLIERPVAPRITPPTPVETKPNLPTPDPKPGQSLTTVLAGILLFLCTLFNYCNATKPNCGFETVAQSCGTPLDTTERQWPTMPYSGPSTQDSGLNATPRLASLPARHSGGCRAS